MDEREAKRLHVMRAIGAAMVAREERRDPYGAAPTMLEEITDAAIAALDEWRAKRAGEELE